MEKQSIYGLVSIEEIPKSESKSMNSQVINSIYLIKFNLLQSNFSYFISFHYLKFVRFSRGDNCHQTTTEQPFRNFRIFIITAKYLFHTFHRCYCKQPKTELTNHSQRSANKNTNNFWNKKT